MREYVAEHGPLPQKAAVRILTDVAKGLKAAHDHKVFHRDISFNNVMLVGNPPIAQLIDFGLGLVADQSGTFTQISHATGTDGFIPPEVRRNAVKRNLAKGDIFSLGALGFYLLVGQTPPPERLSDTRKLINRRRDENQPAARAALPAVSPRLANLIARMLHPEPKHRPDSMGDILEALDHVNDGLNRTAWVGLGALLGVVATVMIGSLVVFNSDAGLFWGLLGLWLGVPLFAFGLFLDQRRDLGPRWRFTIAALLLMLCLGQTLANSLEKMAAANAPPSTVPPTAEARGVTVERHLSRGKVALADGKLDDAEHEFKQAQKLDDSPAVRELLAQVAHEKLWRDAETAYRAGRYDEACDTAERALQIANHVERRQLMAERFAGVGYQAIANTAWAEPAMARFARSRIAGQTRPSNGNETLAPTIRLQTPIDGAWLRETKFVVAGFVEPPQAPETPLRVQGQMVNFNGTAFTAIVELREGRDQTVRVELGAPGPEYAVATLKIHIDTTPPRIVVESPPADHLTNATSVTVAGSCDEAEAELRINGAVVPMRDGRFSLELPVQPGHNEFTVTARDRAGNDATPIRRTVTVKRTAPRIEIMEPTNGALVGATPMTVRGLIDDPDIASVAVNGREVAVSAGQFRTSLTVADGSVTITATARDRAGNDGRVSVTVEVDLSPPRITVEKPASGANVETAEIDVAGRVDDLQATLTIAGRAVPLAGDGRFSQSVPLQVGRNEIPLIATDRLHRATTHTLTITRSAPPTPQPQSGPTTAPLSGEVMTNSIGMQVRRIRAGTFTMGDPEQGDNPPHRVTLTKDFYIGVHPVTNAQYRQFRPNHNSGSYEGHSLNGDDRPVVNVSWHDAVAFCEWLSEKEGRTYRLPTEAEWEYCCRAGRSNEQSKYPWGPNWPPRGKAGNYADIIAKRAFPGFSIIDGYDDGYAVTSPVGRFDANPWGLYDMGGNVWEWCLDAYDSNFCKRDATDPLNKSGSSRVLRSASWYGGDRNVLRAAYRSYSGPSKRFVDFGFRLVVC